MAIEFVGRKSAASSGPIALTGLVGGIGTEALSGDLVVVVAAGGGTSNASISVSSPSGFSEHADLYSNDNYDINLGVYTKIMGETPDTGVTVSSMTNPYTAVFVWRGVDQDNPLDATPTTATGTNSINFDPPSITTVTDNAIVVLIGGMSFTGSAFTPPGGYETLFGRLGEPSIVVCTKTKSVAGVENPPAGSWATDSTLDSWAAVTMALRPSSDGGGNIKIWNGSNWVAKPVKIWNGSAWVTKPVKVWNGSSWVTTPY